MRKKNRVTITNKMANTIPRKTKAFILLLVAMTVPMITAIDSAIKITSPQVSKILECDVIKTGITTSRDIEPRRPITRRIFAISGISIRSLTAVLSLRSITYLHYLTVLRTSVSSLLSVSCPLDDQRLSAIRLYPSFNLARITLSPMFGSPSGLIVLMKPNL